MSVTAVWKVHRALRERPDLLLMWQVDAQSLENHKSITTCLSSAVSEGPQNFYYFSVIYILIYVYHIVLHALFEQDSTLSCLRFLSLTNPSQCWKILLLERLPRCGVRGETHSHSLCKNSSLGCYWPLGLSKASSLFSLYLLVIMIFFPLFLKIFYLNVIYIQK